MTRSRRLVDDFLVPSLNERRYGDLLKWIDRDRLIFSIRWSHKNAAKWSLTDTMVFQDWDKLKGRFHPEIKGYYMQSKQRFRAALYKLSTVRSLDCEDKHVKMYQLILDGSKIVRSRSKMLKGENILDRPSVICENTAYMKKPLSCPMSPVLPLSPNSLSDAEEYKKEYFEPTPVESDQLSCSNSKSDNDEDMLSINEESTPVSPTSHILRENLPVCRTPHLPVQPVPFYHKHSYSPNKGQLQDAPMVFLSRIYNDKNKCDIEHKSYFTPVVPLPGYVEPVHILSEPCALNLSVRYSDNPCR